MTAVGRVLCTQFSGRHSTQTSSSVAAPTGAFDCGIKIASSQFSASSPQRSVLQDASEKSRRHLLFFRFIWLNVASGTDLISLLILFFLFFLLGRPLQKSLMFRRFKLDRDEIRQNCFSSRYTSIDGVGFRM